MIQHASQFDLTLHLLDLLSMVLNAATDQPGESRMTPGKTFYGGPPTGTTLHIKRPCEPHCRIIAIGAGGSVCILSVLTSFCWLLILLLLLLLLRHAQSRVSLQLSFSISLHLIFFSSVPVFYRLLPSTSSFTLHLSVFLSPFYTSRPYPFDSCFETFYVISFRHVNYKLSY